jgi:TonB family protein
MKTNLNIFILAVVLLATQACGPKSEKASEEAVATDVPVENTVVLTLAEKRAKLEEERAAQAERRRIAFEERVKSSPYYTDAKGNVVFNKAEVDPTFVGGDDAMMKYLKENIVFPKDAEEKGLEGTVFVDFVIGANGTVREVSVTDAVGEDVDQSFRNEAVRVVTAMPKWIAGRQNGKSVDVNFSLPVTFQLL